MLSTLNLSKLNLGNVIKVAVLSASIQIEGVGRCLENEESFHILTPPDGRARLKCESQDSF